MPTLHIHTHRAYRLLYSIYSSTPTWLRVEKDNPAGRSRHYAFSFLFSALATQLAIFIAKMDKVGVADLKVRFPPKVLLRVLPYPPLLQIPHAQLCYKYVRDCATCFTRSTDWGRCFLHSSIIMTTGTI